jgi:acyl dehydratase
MSSGDCDLGAIRIGERLPGHTVPITLQRLVMEAGANRDFSSIHVDAEAAAATGADGPYANVVFLETLLEAALRGWAGDRAWIAEIGFTMRRFNCVGDTVTAGGKVTAVCSQKRLAELDIWIESERGTTVEGTAKVEFPIAKEDSDGQ